MPITNEVIINNSENNFVKLCECGCGNPAPIAKQSRIDRNWIKGQPKRFIGGHQQKIKLLFPEPKKAEQIIIGSLMGDGCIYILDNGYRYHEAHCEKQREYLLWKNQFLNFNAYSWKNNISMGLEISKKNITLKEYRELFYPKGKKTVTREILNKLEPLGLAVWYMDDGSYNYGYYGSKLHTCGFNLEENRLIQQWFKEKWDIDCKVQKRKSMGNCYYEIRFGKLNSVKLIEIIKPYIIPSMKYKIGLDYDKERKAKEKKWSDAREYNKRLEVKIHKQEYSRLYIQRPEVKERNRISMRKYNQRPEVKTKNKVWWDNNKDRLNKIKRERYNIKKQMENK